jgi:hypothetical protein
MNPRLISWNVKGLNQRSKRLKIRNLLRQWKADIICLQETKLELISNRIMKSLWGCQFVDWCYLPSSEAFGGILLMWDRRVVEKFEACGGANTSWLVALEIVQITSLGLLLGFMALTLILFVGVYGMNWLVCSICGISFSALVATSMSSTFLVSVQEPLVFLLRRQNSWTLS